MLPSLSDTLLRNIYKFIYKIFYPKTYKHNRRFWPLYRVQRNERGRLEKVYFKNQLVSDNLMIQPAKTSKCMLIATGPSIQQLPNEVFQKTDIDYIGVNGAIALDNIHYNSYIIIDHNFVDARFDLVEKVLQSNCTFYTTPRCLDMILRRIRFTDIQCSIKTIETITRDFMEVFLDEEMLVNKTAEHFFIHDDFGFSKDIFNGTFDYFTVAYVALQIVNSLNYTEIFIAGLDMSNFSKPRFYETTDDKQPTLLDIHSETVLQAFDAAAIFFKEHQISVYNLSPNSAVESFEKRSFEVIG
ncbi:lipopolysaccharide biosynthesis protein [Acinetobacter venetianus]